MDSTTPPSDFDSPPAPNGAANVLLPVEMTSSAIANGADSGAVIALPGRAASPDIAALRCDLAHTLSADRRELGRRLAGIEAAQRRGTPFDRNLNRFLADLTAAKARLSQRLAGVPKPDFSADLPVLGRRSEIEDAIREHQVVVLCGETGSGKSTQLPQICLGMGRGIEGMIGHTQPRRIAARTVAARIAQELRVTVGKEVGFKVRFQDATNPQTYVKLLTDGTLLAETQSDPKLSRYDTLIIDEAHERSLNIDFLLGYLYRLLPQRPDLRVVITSATIDVDRFSQHFTLQGKPAPVIEVSGRTYPVEIVYRPLESIDGADAVDERAALLDAVALSQTYGQGDILIFLPTERDIHDAAKSLRGAARGFRILPLYARLSNEEQQKIFDTRGGDRRIVLATNVAESSLTVPGIRYVIDTGTARVSRYSPRSKLQRLPIEAVSQASANQRAGRCGRIGPGVCIRLYSEADLAARDRFTVPEIQRTNLASVILQTEALKLGRLSDFPLIDAPKPDAIRDGYRSLFELGAVTEEQQLTELGKKLSRLPVDPRIARIIWAAHETHCLGEVLIIAAALETQDPRERPIEKQQAADEAHARFLDEDSDFISLVKVWDFYHSLKDELSRGQLLKACRQNFLSLIRLREWSDVYRELSEVVVGLGWKVGTRHNDWEAVHRALLTGYLSNIAQKQEGTEYLVAGGQRSFLWPGSGLAAKKPKWLVCAEQIETSRRFVRVAARIDPAWVEPVAEHLLNRSYSEPHWFAEGLGAFAYEKVSLFGLPIVPKRRVRYSNIDRAESRRLMIRHGLVEGDFPDAPEFLEHNWALMRELEALQARLRRPVMIRSSEELLPYYDERIPEDVVDGYQLKKWYRHACQQNRDVLRMTRADVLAAEDPAVLADQFPSSLMMGEAELPLEYKLAPGTDDDGITVSIPQAALNQLPEWRLGWLVPGLIEEKIEALIRTLPKDDRRAFVPVPETAKDAAAKIPFGAGVLLEVLARYLNDTYRTRVHAAQFQEDKLPPHLRFNIRILGADNQPLFTGRDLAAIRKSLGLAASESFAQIADAQWQRSGLTKWEFGSLPDSVPLVRAGLHLTGFPAIVDDGAAVGLRLYDSQFRAQRETRVGVRRLFVLAARKELKNQLSWLPQRTNWELQSRIFPPPFPFGDHFSELVTDRAFLEGQPVPRNQTMFEAALLRGYDFLPSAVAEVTALLTPLFQLASELRTRLERLSAAPLQPARLDLQRQAGRLLSSGFLVKTPWTWLCEYPRYLRAMLARIEKLPSNWQRDEKQIDLFTAWMQRYVLTESEHRQRGIFDPELEVFRYAIEELRVATFAQELGTKMSISDKKLEKQWERVSK